MTETTTAEGLVAKLTVALDAEEATAKACPHEHWRASGPPSGDWYVEGASSPHANSWALLAKGVDFHDPGHRTLVHAARQDPARTLRRIAAHREILDRYAETLRDYAYSLKRARGGPIGNADLDDFEAELPVLRSIVEIIAGIYEEPTP